jgi:hypothetical protein
MFPYSCISYRRIPVVSELCFLLDTTCCYTHCRISFLQLLCPVRHDHHSSFSSSSSSSCYFCYCCILNFTPASQYTQYSTGNINRQEPVWKHQLSSSNPMFKSLSHNHGWMDHEKQQDYLFNIACAVIEVNRI